MKAHRTRSTDLDRARADGDAKASENYLASSSDARARIGVRDVNASHREGIVVVGTARSTGGERARRRRRARVKPLRGIQVARTTLDLFAGVSSRDACEGT